MKTARLNSCDGVLKASVTASADRMQMVRRRGADGQAGFTLIELLVVVIILIILATLLLPAMRKVYEGAQSAKCAGNLKTLGNGMLLYVADHDGWFPQYPYDTPDVSGVCWDVKISPYVGVECTPGGAAYSTYQGPPIFHCPNGKPFNENIPINKSRGYAANATITKKFPNIDSAQKPSLIPSLSQFGLIAEVEYERDDLVTEFIFGGAAWNFENAQYYSGFKKYLAWRHNGSMNVCFGDGHVAPVKPSEEGLGYPEGVIWYWQKGVPRGD